MKIKPTQSMPGRWHQKEHQRICLYQRTSLLQKVIKTTASNLYSRIKIFYYLGMLALETKAKFLLDEI
jgi:hypothetical protein